ncbi:response regulator [Paraburkholderia sp. A3BS-1L]|uniref:response regulator n=1 Tax=Paraburkholderia sp. A3BS-1L TaxID=3028375 RepID=UPI003DA8A857
MDTILLVDDDRKILEPLRILLEAEGYRVLTALNGAAAESITEVERPDLIVTDWMMPGVDGVGLCRWLKPDKATAAIPVVMLSAAQPPGSRERLWDVFLRKPTPIARLIAAVSTLLDTSRSVRPSKPHSR